MRIRITLIKRFLAQFVKLELKGKKIFFQQFLFGVVDSIINNSCVLIFCYSHLCLVFTLQTKQTKLLHTKINIIGNDCIVSYFNFSTNKIILW